MVRSWQEVALVCAPTSALEVSPPGALAPLLVTVVTDADGHERTVRGAAVQSFRTGEGSGPNLTATREGRGFIATWVRTGFPMATRSTTSPDRAYVTAVLDAPPGTRWSDHDLARGDVVIYGPEVHHTAVNPEGVSFAFAAMDREALCRTADTMGLVSTLPGPGEVRTLPACPDTSTWFDLVASLASPFGTVPERDPGPQLLRTTVQALVTSGNEPACRRIDNGLVVLACLDYAEKVQRVPSIDEMCAATFVCRRKLWDVFHERYGTSPARFLRSWGLAQARARLKAADPATTTVLDVANNLGFHHAGRFASRYTRMFGEQPSETLRRSA